MVGKIISHSKILSKVGANGMGVAYKAEDTKLKRAVTLKFFSPLLTVDPECNVRFIHETKVASAKIINLSKQDQKIVLRAERSKGSYWLLL